MWEDYWTCVQSYAPRLLDLVILKPGEKEYLVEDLERFRVSRERYRLLGVPYHRGYLFFGPPGTGKTSLISALAARFGMSIYVIHLTDFNDRTLERAMSEVAENSVILFEDIDCVRSSNRRTDAQHPSDAAGKIDAPISLGVTLSGLLNVLDGLHVPSEVVFVMTTNKVEILDAALLRPGRIDYKPFLGEASRSQRTELYLRFFPHASAAEASAFAQAHEGETMAEFQGSLLSLEQRWQEMEPEHLQTEVC